jgi:hypothetical protein
MSIEEEIVSSTIDLTHTVLISIYSPRYGNSAFRKRSCTTVVQLQLGYEGREHASDTVWLYTEMNMGYRDVSCIGEGVEGIS